MHSVHYQRGEDRCARCGGNLPRVILAPDQEMRERHGWHSLIPLCGQCATPEEVAYANTEGTCPGCGIAMQFSLRDAYDYDPRWVACSDRCYQRAWRSSHRMKTGTCTVCRSPFQTLRKDARYCSNTCRQKQHRRRLAMIEDQRATDEPVSVPVKFPTAPP